MVKIKELLKLKPLENFKLIAGENGLDKTVKSVGILEYETCEDMDNTLFQKGDFILTTLFFAKENKKLAEESIRRLIDIEISGIAIKSIYYDSFSKELIDYANDMAVPIFIFNDIYLEDIIISITDVLRAKNNNRFYEEKVNSIIKHEVDRTTVINVAKEINDSFFENILCAYCVEKDYKNDANILRILQNLSFRKNINIHKGNSSIFKYEKGILIIYSFQKNSCMHEKEKIKELIRAIGITKEKFYIGLSHVHYNLNELDICIKESIYAYISCRNKNISYLSYKDIGLDKILIPLKNNYWVEKFSKDIIEPIIDYDKKYNSNLMLTAKKYIENNGDISLTAKEMYQHSNTIRYRLNKIKQITGISKKDNDFYEQLFYAIKLYFIDTKI